MVILGAKPNRTDKIREISEGWCVLPTLRIVPENRSFATIKNGVAEHIFPASFALRGCKFPSVCWHVICSMKRKDY